MQCREVGGTEVDTDEALLIKEADPDIQICTDPIDNVDYLGTCNISLIK